MTFDSHFDRMKKVQKFVTSNGSKIENVYEYRIVNGIKTLVKVSETNIYDKIQSFEPSCNINNIIARFMNGDVDAMNVRKGQYGDFTSVPTSYAELYERIQECEESFNRLPLDIRKKFDNSASKFWTNYGSEEFNSVFNEYFSKKDEKPNEPIKNESEVK